MKTKTNKTKIQADRTTHTNESIKADCILKTTVHVEMMPKVIDYQDILDACQIETDQYPENPFKNDDYLTHDLVTPMDNFDGFRESDQFVHGRRRDWQRIDLSLNKCLTNLKYWAKLGASRQVAFEKVAQEKRHLFAQIKKVYDEGYESFLVTCDFLDEDESIGGYDSYEFAEDEGKKNVASEIVARLKKRGFIIENLPIRTKQIKWGYSKEDFKRKLNQFNTERR